MSVRCPTCAPPALRTQRDPYSVLRRAHTNSFAFEVPAWIRNEEAEAARFVRAKMIEIEAGREQADDVQSPSSRARQQTRAMMHESASHLAFFWNRRSAGQNPLKSGDIPSPAAARGKGEARKRMQSGRQTWDDADRPRRRAASALEAHYGPPGASTTLEVARRGHVFTTAYPPSLATYRSIVKPRLVTEEELERIEQLNAEDKESDAKEQAKKIQLGRKTESRKTTARYRDAPPAPLQGAA